MTTVSMPLLRAIRSMAATWLTDRCTLETPTGAVSATGAPTQAYQAVALNVPCRALTAGHDASSDSDVLAGRESITRLQRIAFPPKEAPYGWDLSADMRITLANGTRWHMAGIDDSLTDPLFRVALVMREE